MKNTNVNDVPARDMLGRIAVPPPPDSWWTCAAKDFAGAAAKQFRERFRFMKPPVPRFSEGENEKTALDAVGYFDTGRELAAVETVD